TLISLQAAIFCNPPETTPMKQNSAVQVALRVERQLVIRFFQRKRNVSGFLLAFKNAFAAEVIHLKPGTGAADCNRHSSRSLPQRRNSYFCRLTRGDH